MKHVPRWRRYLRLAKPNVFADVDDELSFHIDMRVQDNLRGGMPPDEARREALERFGAVEPVRDSLVDHDRSRQNRAARREWFADVRQDIAFGARSLRRAPGFAAAATLTLALGIGANTAIFSVVDALLLRPLPYERPQELMFVGAGSAGEFLALQERLHAFRDLATYAHRQLSIDDGRDVVRVPAVAVTPNFFRTLGVSPMLGSGFTEENGIAGQNYVAIISHRLWERQFGAQEGIVGKRVTVDQFPVTIIGVMDPDFHYPSNTTEVWLPGVFNPANAGSHWAVQNNVIIGRVKSGISLGAARQDVKTTWPTLRRLNPLWDPGDQYALGADPAPLQETMVGAPRTLLWVLLGCVTLVLLIACVNVANLLLARATAREREIAVRSALGGGRGRLIRQLITESVLLSAIGAALGVLLAVVAVRWLVSIVPPGVPRVEEIAVNATALLVTAGVAILTGLLFGLVPAIRATNAAGGMAMIGRRVSAGPRHQRIAGALVAAEVALAVMLVIGAQLLVRSFAELRSVETGFATSNVIAARVSPPGASYSMNQPEKITQLYNGILSRLASVPGVQRVAAVDRLPIAATVYGVAVKIEGQFEDGSKVLPEVQHLQSVTAGYFTAMGIPIKEGRAIDATDGPSSMPVAMVSEAMAKKFWPNESAIGKRVSYPFPHAWLTVVGVVPDVRQDSLRDTVGMSMYVPWEQRTRMSASEMWVIARTRADPHALAGSIRSIVKEIDRTVPVSDVRTMDEVIERSMQRDRFLMLLVGLFASSALLLGVVGIYGVMSYLVSQRTQEMGVRIALGASTSSVLGMVVRRGAVMAGTGAVVGVVAAVWATRPLAAFLYGVSATDPLTYASVPVAFLLVALLASLVPARRATRVDPVRALRAD